MKAAGSEVVRAEKRSGTTTQGREELRTVLDFLRKGDVLMVKRAERRLGELIEADRTVGKLARNKPGPGRGKKGQKAGSSKDPAFSDHGIDKNLADRARKAAATETTGSHGDRRCYRTPYQRRRYDPLLLRL
jgi:hypothetical protein